MYAMAKILEMMAVTGIKLAELDKTLPHLRFVKKNISCPWDYKGKVMRHIMKDTEHLRRELLDGVKIFPDAGDAFASILLLPDRERPLFHIKRRSARLDTSKANQRRI